MNVIKSGTETTLVVDRSKRTLRTNGDHKDLKAKQFGSRKDSDSLGKSAVCLQIVKKKPSWSWPIILFIAFGDLYTNGYVFIGGLPSWYSEKMDSIVLPTTLLEPRFRGSIRNLKYRDARSDQEQAQAMMAFKVMAFLDIFGLFLGVQNW